MNGTGKTHRWRTVLLAAVASGAALVTTAPLASADVHALYGPSYIGSNSGGANLRTCPNTGCSVIAYNPNGTLVTMQCWTDTQWVYPPASDYASPRWFRIATPRGTGYTHSSLVENQTSVGHC
ncbi:hypothetical protein Lesp02_13410 [Lentzea sp. NBRC 105346]|uniref:SH3 domain-containing protein n=1 Tax=Lentzea sp. NBRC 105346 TaxID=3032205 RepID=UPI00249F9924|nr:SH3 domain-containing protein [Lentzea sp. NBRC 105346]GLZ29151.1 hypothetical protein Lesp02_13410 [Lentzea sp. NBRC 105346]